MLNLAYSEVMADAPSAAREREREAIQRSISLMESAEKAGTKSRETIVALNFVRSLWTILIEDLASADNMLPPVLRAQLISIGISILRQSEDIRLERTQSFGDLIEISRLIMEGLK
ncbi:MAG: flagellar biosynthesis regulator FlaF [Proteobacteria bacterium]|nr:flagellar biosynthesis regulator FlaF [Pseudomonadota bacterium]